MGVNVVTVTARLYYCQQNQYTRSALFWDFT